VIELSGGTGVVGVSEGGGWQAPTVASKEAPATTGARLLSAALIFELLWLVLVAASVVFLAAHLGADADDFPADPVARRVVLVVLPPAAVIIGLALVGARRAVDRHAISPSEPIDSLHRVALWVSAVANVAVVLSIVTSLYHAHMTWIVVGLLLVAALSLVAWACARLAGRH
jgi:hypothetical protein